MKSQLSNSFLVISAAFISQCQAALDRDAIAEQHFGNDSPWFINRIPFFETNNPAINDVYYYRWKIFRAHQRDTGASGFVSTEFLDDVSWQTQPMGTLNDASAFHILEGRWCHDLRYKQDYATFMYSGQSNQKQFSESIADAVWQSYLTNGDSDFSTSLLTQMQSLFQAWSSNFDTSKGLYYIEPLADATEYTIASIDASGGFDGFGGGNAFRPSINSYQYANARAIAKLATLKGGLQSTVDAYNKYATNIKSRFQTSHWNSTFEHFIDRFQVKNNKYVKYWDFIRGRELVGYVPWAHDLPDDAPRYAQAWKHILNTNELAGAHGLRTVEPSYQYFMRQYRYDGNRRECQWNGPSWPYQTTQVLKALSNLLDHYPKSAGIINSADYVRLLDQYARIHYQNGILNLEEDYDAATGEVIVCLDRSPHYFHSGFVDVVLSGLVGIRSRADNFLEVNPLIDSTITYFRAENILYHGRNVSVQWDVNGSRYGRAGLLIEVDGKQVAQSATLKRIVVALSRGSLPSIARPLAKSIQPLTSTSYPRGNVSTPGVSAEVVHDVIDGRVMFWDEFVNGWTTPADSGAPLWYEIDFGTSATVSKAEVAFYASSDGSIDVPTDFSVEVNNGSGWVAVSTSYADEPVANGVATVRWSEVSTNVIRLSFTPKTGKQVRLVEFKVF